MAAFLGLLVGRFRPRPEAIAAQLLCLQVGFLRRIHIPTSRKTTSANLVVASDGANRTAMLGVTNDSDLVRMVLKVLSFIFSLGATVVVPNVVGIPVNLEERTLSIDHGKLDHFMDIIATFSDPA